MLLELQRSPVPQHPGQRSATVIGHRTPSSWPRAGLHPVRQRLGRAAGGRRHGDVNDRADRVQQLVSREGAAASTAEDVHGVDGLHVQDVDVKAILSDPHLEGDPLQFLKVTEAYWTVRPLRPPDASARLYSAVRLKSRRTKLYAHRGHRYALAGGVMACKVGAPFMQLTTVVVGRRP